MSRVRAQLVDWIRRHGPLDVARFMGLCAALRGGYLERGAGPGAQGDFVTAPELSQIFGELIGLSFIAHWKALGRPRAVRIAELGPGRGTLMADLWRALGTCQEVRAAVRSVELVELSPALRALQAERLAALPVRFRSAVEQLPQDLPLFVIANEFFDALPIHQYLWIEGAWRERLVALGPEGGLAFALAPWPAPLPPPQDPSAPVVRELSPAREALAAVLAERIVQSGGFALVIDYGEPELMGDTLQAVHRHRRVDPLDRPGEADLSSLVDFGALARAAASAGAEVYGPLAQGRLLARLGIRLRLARLVAEAGPGSGEALVRGVERLLDPQAMGERFKALALVPPGAPPPPGFAAEERWR